MNQVDTAQGRRDVTRTRDELDELGDMREVETYDIEAMRKRARALDEREQVIEEREH